MTPQYDFSIALGEEINLQCNVINPNSLNDAVNGSLVLKKDGSVLSGYMNLRSRWFINCKNFNIIKVYMAFMFKWAVFLFL